MTHYMRKKEEIEKIAELFARFRAEVENLNSLNLYDINIHAENVIIPILNIVYGLNLVNINNEVKNSSAIDLVDTDNRIAIQVTSTATGEKIKHTIREYSSTVPISINLFNGSSLLSKGLKDMILSSKVNQSLLYGIFNNSNALLSTFPMGAFFLSLYGVLQDCVIISSRSIPVMPI